MYNTRRNWQPNNDENRTNIGPLPVNIKLKNILSDEKFKKISDSVYVICAVHGYSYKKSLQFGYCLYMRNRIKFIATIEVSGINTICIFNINWIFSVP